jgi:hypothetical protein
MTMKFLLHKDKEEKGKPTAQKQECGCPLYNFSLVATHMPFFLTKGDNAIKW